MIRAPDVRRLTGPTRTTIWRMIRRASVRLGAGSVPTRWDGWRRK